MGISQDLSSFRRPPFPFAHRTSTPILILINFNVYVAAVTVARQESWNGNGYGDWDGVPGGSRAVAKMIMSN